MLSEQPNEGDCYQQMKELDASLSKTNSRLPVQGAPVYTVHLVTRIARPIFQSKCNNNDQHISCCPNLSARTAD
jgi:hypothetical protein